MKILVTGATGFIGGYVVEKLVNEGHLVKCLIRETSNLERLEKLKNIDFFFGDITQKDTLNGIATDVDIVLHLAATGHVSAISDKALREFTSINEQGTENLIEECLKNKKIKKFIHFSSTAAMGLIEKQGLIDESDEPQPRTPYQISKRKSELKSLSYYYENNFPVVIVRPCMVYGPRGKGEFLKFCRLMRKGIFPRIGFGKILTPMVYVEDLANGAVQAMSGARPGEIYILASEKSFDLNEIRNMIMSTLNEKKPYLFAPKWAALFGAKLIEILSGFLNKEPIVTYKNIKSTIANREFDISKAKSDFSYAPNTSLQIGIRNTIDWYKANNLI